MLTTLLGAELPFFALGTVLHQEKHQPAVELSKAQ